MREYGKSILGFLSLVITNLLTNYTAGGTVLPIHDGQLSWGALAVNVATTAIGAYSVYKWDNRTNAGKHEAK